MRELLAILDAGAQYSKNIDGESRALKVESDILSINTPANELEKYKAIIISGGPQSVYGKNAPGFDPEIFSLGKPILGICYGMQLMNHVFGGTVGKDSIGEYGACEINVDTESKLFSGLEDNQTVLMSHGDSIGQLAHGFEKIAKSNGLTAAIENTSKGFYGVQFHPEIDMTEHGKEMLHNFLYDIAGFTGTYTMENRETKAIKEIQDTVGNKIVLLMLSGGVDSTVLVALVSKALGSERVYAIHIDNGFMRLNESPNVKIALNNIGVKVQVIDASADFYNGTTEINGIQTLPLNQTIDPQHKRHIIGDTFMHVADKAIRALGLDPTEVYLAQGTLRPDLIESASKLASGNAEVIKTHHNDTELVRKLRDEGRVIEPLRDYHKDEVRELGINLGLPEDIVYRQPFPGPGLGIRIICAEEAYIQDDFEGINTQLQQFLTEGIYEKLKNPSGKADSRLETLKTEDINATLLPIQTVGVQGDGRSFSYLAGLSGRKNWSDLITIAQEIPKSFSGINRIAYIFGEPVLGSVTEITPTYLTPDVIHQLQLADDIVNQELVNFNLMKTLSQVPVVSFPVNFGIEGNHSIGIRPFISPKFMTGRPAIPGEDFPEEALDNMVERILNEVKGISRVVYDLTSKPPGTIEWE